MSFDPPNISGKLQKYGFKDCVKISPWFAIVFFLAYFSDCAQMTRWIWHTKHSFGKPTKRSSFHLITKTTLQQNIIPEIQVTFLKDHFCLSETVLLLFWNKWKKCDINMHALHFRQTRLKCNLLMSTKIMLETMLMVMILMTLMVRVRLLSLARAEDRATDIGWDARWQCSTTIFWGQFCSTWGGGDLNTSCQECREPSTHDWDWALRQLQHACVKHQVWGLSKDVLCQLSSCHVNIQSIPDLSVKEEKREGQLWNTVH